MDPETKAQLRASDTKARQAARARRYRQRRRAAKPDPVTRPVLRIRSRRPSDTTSRHNRHGVSGMTPETVDQLRASLTPARKAAQMRRYRERRKADGQRSVFTVEWTPDGLIAGEIPLGPEMGGSWGALDRAATAEQCDGACATRPRATTPEGAWIGYEGKASDLDPHGWDTDSFCNADRWRGGKALVSRRACRAREHPDRECREFFEGRYWSHEKYGPAKFPNRAGAAA